MKLNWKKRFLRDLNEAAAYIADDDPDAADRWLDSAVPGGRDIK